MRRHFLSIVLAALVGVGSTAVLAQNGWTIPPNGSDEKSPLTSSPELLKKGKSMFQSRCQHCHGPEGKGDGPDAPPDLQSDMDLTSLNDSDGTIFYKVWNGRKKPKMPAFKTEMTKTEVWTIVEYVKSLK
jgi:mono/diheme cytochrome c family protein